MDQPMTPTAPTQQPMLLGQLFRAAWSTFVKHWKTIVLLTLIVSLPLNLLSAITSAQIGPNTGDPQQFLNGIKGVFGAGLGITVLLASLAGILIPLGIVAIVRAGDNNQTLDIQTAFGQAASRWGAGLVTSLIMVVLLIGLALLLVVPAIIFGVFWAFAIFAVMHDNLQGMAALKESKRVVQGHWWKVFGNVIAFGFVAGIAGSILSAPFYALPVGVIQTTVTSTITSVTSSFALVAGYLLYRSLKAATPAPPNAK